MFGLIKLPRLLWILYLYRKIEVVLVPGLVTMIQTGKILKKVSDKNCKRCVINNNNLEMGHYYFDK